MIRPRIHDHLAALLAVLSLPLGITGCNVIITEGPACVVDGKTFAPGDSFLDADGCNTCTCTDEGGVACTELACGGSTCTYQGKVFQPGETFHDDCNSCQCQGDGTVGCTAKACLGTCEQGGQTYQEGETFPAGDGCNTCTCEADGLVSCTLALCAGCSYAGKEYAVGQSFPSIDKCNTCTCGETGNVSCTEIACVCDPEGEWWRDYVSTDPVQCQVIDFGCPANTKGFESSCGCGCEQDASCPEVFDCMPPAQCDLEKLKEECPYSGFVF